MRSWERFPTFCLLLSAAAVGGCASLDPGPDYARSRRMIADATGVVSDETAPEAIAARVRDLLEDGLTVAEAVQICLINNPSLQAAFVDIGLARADMVQSTLFSNPTLAMSIAFPEGGGLSNIQATFAQNIVDVWQIPVRRRAADRALDAAILRVAQRAIELTNETRRAYFGAVAADQIGSIAGANVQLAEQLLSIAEARQRAGAVGALDVNLSRGTVYSAELESRRARLEARALRRQLATLLGLTSAVEDLALATPLSGINVPVPDAGEAIGVALSARPDIRAAREVSEAALARERLEVLKVFPQFAIGFYDERNEARALPGRRIPADTARASVAAGQLSAPEIQSRAQRDQARSQEIENIFGPAFSVTLPVFDQNQAQIAKARLAHEQAAAELDALERAAVQQVRQALDQVETTRDIIRYFRESLEPQAQSNLDLSRRSYEVGRASVIVLLDAQRVLLSTRRDAVAAERDHAIAVAELERVVSRPIAKIRGASVTTAPADETQRPAIEE